MARDKSRSIKRFLSSEVISGGDVENRRRGRQTDSVGVAGGGKFSGLSSFSSKDSRTSESARMDSQERTSSYEINLPESKETCGPRGK